MSTEPQAERLEARLREKSPQDWQAYREFLDKKLALDTKEKQVEEVRQDPCPAYTSLA